VVQDGAGEFVLIELLCEVLEFDGYDQGDIAGASAKLV
jgi:hypothetical protein